MRDDGAAVRAAWHEDSTVERHEEGSGMGIPALSATWRMTL